MALVYLTVDEVVEIHRAAIERHGGDLGALDRGCLESALALPAQSAGGEDAYGSMEAKAAAYLFHLAKKHCFSDGNKRIGLIAALTFLAKNGLWLNRERVRPRDGAKVTLDVVNGRCSLKQLTGWFARRIVAL